MVFQNYALYPHMTVEENIAFGLKLRRVPKDERRARPARSAQVLGIEHLLDGSRPRSPAVSASAWRWAGRWSASPSPS